MSQAEIKSEAEAHGHFDVRAYGQVWLEVCPEEGTVRFINREMRHEMFVDISQLDAVITAFTSVRELLKEKP